MTDLQGILDYYQARVNDLRLFSEHGTPWDFVCGAMLLEWIANLTDPDPNRSWLLPQIKRPYFVDMVTKWLPDYAEFEFETLLVDIDDNTKKTRRYLPLQLYLTLRNPLVHSFSLIPTDQARDYVPPETTTSCRKLGRPGCLVLGHQDKMEKRGDGKHLALLKEDRCLLRSPDFVEDVGDLITACFEEAKGDVDLNDRIRKRFQERRPVDTINEITIVREGPKF